MLKKWRVEFYQVTYDQMLALGKGYHAFSIFY